MPRPGQIVAWNSFRQDDPAEGAGPSTRSCPSHVPGLDPPRDARAAMRDARSRKAVLEKLPDCRPMTVGEHSARYLSAMSRARDALRPEADRRHGSRPGRGAERGGRLFILGVGGGAGHASHAVNDFRKLCAIESYAPTDNVSELTARTNDDGWETSFSAWLEVSRLSDRDALLVFSVGGGSREHNVSTNLVGAMEAAREVGAVDLRGRRRARGTLGRAGGRGDLIEPRRSCARRSWSPCRRSSGMRWSPIRSWPSNRVTGSRWRTSARERAGRAAEPLLAPARATRRVDRRAAFLDRDGILNEAVPDPTRACSSRRCASRTCG